MLLNLAVIVSVRMLCLCAIYGFSFFKREKRHRLLKKSEDLRHEISVSKRKRLLKGETCLLSLGAVPESQHVLQNFNAGPYLLLVVNLKKHLSFPLGFRGKLKLLYGGHSVVEVITREENEQNKTSQFFLSWAIRTRVCSKWADLPFGCSNGSAPSEGEACLPQHSGQISEICSSLKKNCVLHF